MFFLPPFGREFQSDWFSCSDSLCGIPVPAKHRAEVRLRDFSLSFVSWLCAKDPIRKGKHSSALEPFNIFLPICGCPKAHFSCLRFSHLLSVVQYCVTDDFPFLRGLYCVQITKIDWRTYRKIWAMSNAGCGSGADLQ